MRLFQRNGWYHVEYERNRSASLRTKDIEVAEAAFEKIQKSRSTAICLDMCERVSIPEFKATHPTDSELSPQTIMGAEELRKAYEKFIYKLRADIISAIEDTCVPVRYMSLKQASLYSGIGQNMLIKLAKAGKIKGQRRRELKRGDWSFDRKSIDEYWHKPFDDVKRRAKEILAEINKRRGCK